MALAKMTWDELNQLVGHKISEPYEEYFDPMRISDEQKQRRIDFAKEIEIVIVGMLMSFFYDEQYETSNYDEIYARAIREYLEVATAFVIIDDYMRGHAEFLIADAIATMERHREKDDYPWYFSEDRAMAMSENDSNTVIGHDELEEAVSEGMRYKTWHTIMDGRERDSHAEVNELTIPIDEPFELPGGMLMCPGDDSMGASDEELANCRCACSYS